VIVTGSAYHFSTTWRVKAALSEVNDIIGNDPRLRQEEEELIKSYTALKRAVN
jgi:hypothetical protein